MSGSAVDHRLWPGKARPANPFIGPTWHPTTFHCLDVMACALALMRANPARMERLAALHGVERNALERTFALLIALHDVGKLSEKFCTVLDHCPPVTSSRNRRGQGRHWQISHALLVHEMDDAIERAIGGGDEYARCRLYEAVTGHHGQPPSDADAERTADLVGVPAALAFLDDVVRLLPDNGPITLREKTASRLSWTLAGLTVVADWLGSNQRWFPYTDPCVPFDVYWERARRQASFALPEAGLAGTTVASRCGLGPLFGIDEPRPMQRAAVDCELPPGPTLAIVEDVTGSGKTEAAVALAQRFMVAGKGEGVYVALPTMATANAMFGRLGESYRRLFADDETPSLALAHGQRRHSEDFRRAVEFATAHAADLTAAGKDFPAGGPGDSVAAACAEWVADDMRKVFLAEVGVGTIDQAFLGVLPVRFSTLRLWGLGQRVLIVDEAHACDDYMREELDRVLTMQAALGGSAIVMTATLPASLRSKLAAAFRRGLGVAPVPIDAHYPALTVVATDDETCRSVPVDSLDAFERSVPVRVTDSEPALLERLERDAAAGAACVWVRNTVDQAIATAAALRARDVAVDLFHARFAMGDRLAIEGDVLDRYGKDADPARRRGRVLVATQVVEQSLDLDFDVVVSDLAPIDLLIQRAGRLWRHMDRRPAASRPVAERLLHVLSPDPDEVKGAAWAIDVLGNGARVYDVGTLWRTAKVLRDAGSIDSPDGLVTLIEGVAGDEAVELPEALHASEARTDSDRLAERATARRNVVAIDRGYGESGALTEESCHPTRLGDPRVRLVLAKANGDRLVPWNDGALDGWSASEVSISQWRYEKQSALLAMQERSDVRVAVADWPEWRREQSPVAIVGTDGRITDELRYDAIEGLVFAAVPA